MRVNIFNRDATKRDTTETVTEQDPSVGSGEATSNTNNASSDDIELAQQRTADLPLSEKPEETAQGGVKEIEAITLSWSKPHVVIAYVCMFLLYFTNAFQASITSNLSAYITSGFESHSLIPVISIVSNVMTAAAYLPIAKILDVWGRPVGFSFMTMIAVLGMILSATCKDIETYCAAQVFYSVGFTGMIFSVDVITADTSSMRDRGLAFAFTSSPYIITAFAGPKAAENFYDSNWRWAYGCWAIVLPVVALPLWWTLWSNKRKATKNGLLVKKPSGRTWLQSTWFYIVEFDLAGVILIAAGLVLFLLPFSIAESAENEWRTAHIIVMLVIGVVCLIGFAVFERWVAPKPFIPYALLLSRNIMGACLLDATYQIAYYCWNAYFTSYLQVVYNQSLATAGYISGIFDVVSGIWLLGVGFLIRYTGRYKWLLQIAVPLYILFVGLLIYFRRPETGIGYIIMVEIFISVAGGTMIIGQQVAIMAVADHNDVAAVLAILGLFGYMGGAVGNSISGAIWTNTLPKALQEYLPAETVDQWEAIYDDLTVQLSYPIGDATRDAIIKAYALAQQRMLIAGTAIMALALIWVFMLKNIKVSDMEQVKGVLF
ncbi:MFS siderophore transporter [Lasiodiplodia theobromae]|uniref:MFS siderophore transporter n=1 Tax=Lasiodiplodia theobromae TaxID=45133 RepID=UPI0015C36C71|nr:MFS siderophore transporter [Lasiodiplodia theobromae]KAF4536420.1 MFS siderophore transporter [Lasiodiplodia theobromae]